jgi:hypothetical protein
VDSTPESVSNEVQAAAVQDVQRDVDAAVRVSGAIAEQASQVSDEVSSLAERLVDDATAQVRDGADAQLRQVADGLEVLHRQTGALAQGRPDEAGPLVEYMLEATQSLGDLAEHIRKGGLDGVAADIKRIARKRPVTFLVGSAVAGLAIGRLLRNEAAAVQARLAHNRLSVGETSEESGERGPESGQGSDPGPPVAVGDAEQ